MKERSKIMCVAVLILSVLAMSSTALALRGMSVQQPLSAERILEASARISITGKVISGTAKTTASAKCARITSVFTLQKWNGSAWLDHKTASKNRQESAISVETVAFSAVASGSYRLKVSHRIYSGSVLKDSRTSYTNSVTVP